MKCPKRCPIKTRCNKTTNTCETKRNMKLDLAFLFLTYDDILHDITKKFIKNYTVYVNAKTPNKIKSFPYTITNYPTEWAKKSIVDATVHLLNEAYKKNHAWYILLAYDALPLVKPSKLESVLRYQTKSMFHLIEKNEVEWKTSQWWILTRRDVQVIVENKHNYDEYLKKTPFTIRGAWDELYFLSLLNYVNPAYQYQECATTYVKWLSKTVQVHPVTYGKLLSTDIEEIKDSFFIRKTTSTLTTTLHTPRKRLIIKVFGTDTVFSVPPNADLILVTMIPTHDIPESIVNQSIHIYFSKYKFLNTTIEELLNTIPAYMWDSIHVLDETCNRISKESGCYAYTPNKIAFLFLTIGDINQPRVWTEYFKNNQHKCSIYINPKHPDLIQTGWLKNRVIPSRVENTGWGFITEAYHNLLEEAMKDPYNVKFVFISESCIPLKSFDSFYETMMSNIKTSYVKFMKPSVYDRHARIETQEHYKKYDPFIKHYARMCLSRYHVEKLLKRDFTFFNKMHVGDEFFLTLIHLKPGIDHVKDFEITYDNWEDVNHQASLLNDEIKKLYNKPNTTDMIRRKKIIRDRIRSNPITYTSITTEDLRRALNKESFFWRKFTPDPLPWTSEILNIT